MACELATEQHAHPTIAAILKFLEILTLTWYHDLHRQVSQLETEGTPVPAPLREQVAFFVANTADLALMLTSLREQTLPLRIVEWLQAIMTCLQRGDLQGATTTYLELAIGNAPWPIGATMVGIHERSSREKLFSEKLAHIMDDQQRKRAILSVKGLISFARQLSSSSQ
jgi:pre-mRNA-splicing factor 18